MPVERLVERDAETELVAARVAEPPHVLLNGHVGRGPDERADLRHLAAQHALTLERVGDGPRRRALGVRVDIDAGDAFVLEAREAEVGDLDAPARVDQDVLWLEVAESAKSGA